MKELLASLLKLQALEFGEVKDKNADVTIAKLRGNIPPQILYHYDRLAARGKKGVSLVRDQVCTGCHMRLPIAVINTLMRGSDIQLCDTCGRYLCLAEQRPEPAAEQSQPARSARKTRKPKQPLHAV
jgi:predicted  nucleic acid-binding Zn-ribbon protein